MADKNPPRPEDGLIVLMPVFGDWDSVEILLPLLDGALQKAGESARVLLVDDGSIGTDATGEIPSQTGSAGPRKATDLKQLARCEKTGMLIGSYEHLTHVDLLRLRRNLGHQRAICVGLSYIAEHHPACTTVVMDSDGEDDPHDVPRLLARAAESSGKQIVFAQRRRRSEGLIFRLFYLLYRWFHLLLVGYKVRFGNFSVVPPSSLQSLVVVPELWSHYAAAVLSSKLPYCAVPCDRAKRLAGESKMDFVGLVVHGLSALAVFSDRVGTRVLLGSLLLIALTLVGIPIVVGIRLGTDMAIPGWATYAVGVLVIVLGQLITLATTICFIVLSQRSQLSFLPVNNYAFFLQCIECIWKRDE